MANSRRAVCRVLGALALGAGIGALTLAAPGAYAQDKPITLGFAQVGAESAWRTANTESIKSAAADAEDQPQILGRPAEAGKPDQGDPLVYRAESRCDRVFAGGGIRLGADPARSEGREDSCDPD